MKAFDNEKIAGQVILAGFEGTVLPRDLAKNCEQGAVGGLVLFKRNIENPAQVSNILTEARKRAPENAKPITAIDQEGGRVIRIREPLCLLPPARVFGKIDDPTFTYSAGRLAGLELKALGFTVNFAPVLDIDTNPDSPVIADRSYGENAQIVIRHGFAFARGLKDGGVFPCAKHFPGHGDANVDSHLSLPIIKHDIRRLQSVEMEPFIAWARTGLGPIMSAHIIFEALDSSMPATASKKILTQILREKMRFSGVVFTDDLEMGALKAFGGAKELAVKIIYAGADGLLVCKNLDLRKAIIFRLAKEATDNLYFARLLEKAALNLQRVAYSGGPFVDLSWIGSSVHNKLKIEIITRLNKEEN